MKVLAVIGILVFYATIIANLFMNGALSAVLTLVCGITMWTLGGMDEGKA